ncbi:MAG: S-methyl-5-thioribose-1-phosphate isomerase [Candidatus Mcinerneyibacterium aminivorans]|uniref:Methylthioribose-1-phosphate isomerase n=1 Tax=Candidatus Mcinerneyibacterium aminivorans TaxID=2703815 RepID=A0A5D0MJZ9_9BACT|nr:MAG: S-methyl-5-thioribose-1-phosphate isomerase [Candidatus Mcinerneyibacterium aminivorans]
MEIKSIYVKENYIEVIDQRLLPHKLKKMKLKKLNDVCFAISNMVIRGAPLIGVAASFGFYFGIREYNKISYIDDRIEVIVNKLINTRPTAVNLIWAVNRMKNRYFILRNKYKLETIKNKLKNEANKIYEEDIKMCHKIGLFTNQYIKNKSNILTHCNAGSLATSKYGTALSGIYIAKEKNKDIHIWVNETRPWLQGARLTAWELNKNKVKNTLIVDSAAGSLMRKGKIDLVIVGADRIAANGDVANKIGTYSLSVLAKENNIPFIVAAPTSTVDNTISSGKEIEIEERSEEEIIKINDTYIAQKDQKVLNPVFDITPYENITHIITEKGEFYKND